MANISTVLVVLLSLVFLVLMILSPGASGSAKFGGRIPVPNVRSNKEVQELGRYSVQEYNRMLQQHKDDNGKTKLLTFSEVVEAEKQVVSGIKYYLKISAAVHGDSKTYDAVVWLKPGHHAKELLQFNPSTPLTNMYQVIT